jgi:tetratricopeptide (TPR) repeat protein
MWRKLFQLIAAGMLATFGASASFAVPEQPGAQDSAQQLLEAYDSAMFNERFGDALAAANKIHLDEDRREARAIVAAMRASALLGLKREAEARKQIAESETLDPISPEPGKILFLGSLLAKRFDIAADTIDRMIAKFPDGARDVDPQLMRFFLVNEPKGQERRNDDRRIALARIGYGGDTERGHYIAQEAVETLVKRGDYSAAADLLADVKEPVALENMLIQKRYAPLWPQIEQVAGAHMANARAQSVAAAERALASSPDDHEALANYANALRHAGRLDEAIALRSKIPSTSAAMSSADEQMGWTINNIACALHEAGRPQEADDLLALLNNAPMPQEYWRVNMKINRLEMLVLDGRFDKALPLIEPTAKTEGSPYADQLVRRLRYCTLIRLGKDAEAATFKGEMLAHAADAAGATIDGLLCVGDLDGAEKIALTALANPDADKRMTFEQDFVRQLQTHVLTADDPSAWQGRWAELRKRPAIESAFERLGRDMPAEYVIESPH